MLRNNSRMHFAAVPLVRHWWVVVGRCNISPSSEGPTHKSCSGIRRDATCGCPARFFIPPQSKKKICREAIVFRMWRQKHTLETDYATMETLAENTTSKTLRIETVRTEGKYRRQLYITYVRQRTKMLKRISILLYLFIH